MPPKRNNAAAATTTETTPSTTTTPAASTPVKIPSKHSHQSPQEVALSIWRNYLDKTPQRTKLIDVFMAFLVVVGGLQFLYCILVGNYVGYAFTPYVIEGWAGTIDWNI
ncbi:oligosaccharyltransferase complex subunit epsilon [Clarireedia jacksonii]